MGGGLPWLPTALSTIKPATSPLLSVVGLHFSFQFTAASVRPLIQDGGNHLRWAADEVTRIEREFEGAMSFTVSRNSLFDAVLDKLNVRIRPCVAGNVTA